MKKVSKWFGVMGDKLFKKTVNPIDLLNSSLRESKTRMNELKGVNYEYKGKVIYYRAEIENDQKKIEELKSGAKKCIENKDDVLLLRCKKQIDLLNNRIENNTRNLEISTKFADKTYMQLNMAKNRMVEIESKLEELKMKADFKKEVDKFSKIMGNSEDEFDFSEIEKEIEINYNTSEVKLDDIIVEESDLNDLTKENGLEKFKKELMGE